MSVQDSFAALTNGIEVVVKEGAGCEEGKRRAATFAQPFVEVRNERRAYVASNGSICKGSFVVPISCQMLEAINQDLAETTKPIGKLAAMLKVSLPNGPL